MFLINKSTSSIENLKVGSLSIIFVISAIIVSGLPSSFRTSAVASSANDVAIAWASWVCFVAGVPFSGFKWKLTNLSLSNFSLTINWGPEVLGVDLGKLPLLISLSTLVGDKFLSTSIVKSWKDLFIIDCGRNLYIASEFSSKNFLYLSLPGVPIISLTFLVKAFLNNSLSLVLYFLGFLTSSFSSLRAFLTSSLISL